jgi:hypothetical protein
MRYVVGTRDANGVYRAVRIDAENMSNAKEIAVRRMEDLKVYATAVSCKRINALGMPA